MKHYYIFRYRWAPEDDSQWPFFSFLARRDISRDRTGRLIVPFVEEAADGTTTDPMGIKRLITITELTQIGSQSLPQLKRVIGGEECLLSVYTMDLYQARAQPLIEGGSLEIIFEDEIINQGNVFTSPLDPLWNDILTVELTEGELVRGHRGHPAPLIRYHGTSMEAYESILKSGLRPTKRLGMVGNNLYYFGHYLKALRYSFQDSERKGALRKKPVLLRYALFVKPDDVLRLVKGRSPKGTLETRPLTEEDIRSIPARNRDILTLPQSSKDTLMKLYGKDVDSVGPYRVLKRESPFDSWEDARKALYVGDQDIRKDPSTYFTTADETKDTKAYEVDSFWIPVKDASYPNGVRYYSLTKLPEIALKPEKNCIRLVGSFAPFKPPSLTDAESIRDPFVLLQSLNTVARFPVEN